jgi:hypothetical protein
MTRKVSIKSFINIFIILISLIITNAQDDKYISILSVNGGKEIEAGKTASIKFKFLSQTSDKAFNFVLRDENKKVFIKVGTVDDTKFQFNKGNTYDIDINIPEKLDFNEYLLYAYLDEENKVSDSFSVKVKSNSDNESIDNNQNVISNNTLSNSKSGSIGTSQPNVSTAGNSSGNENSKVFNWSNIIIIGSIIGIILVIFIVFCFCVKNGKKRNDDVWNLPPSVSEPHLVSSSSPINAIPLQYKNNLNQNINGQQFISTMSPGSPVGHSNYIEGLTSNNNVNQSNNIQSPPQAYIHDTIYSNNLSESMNSPQDDEISSPSPSYYYQTFKPHQVYRVLYDFQPSLPDEMEVQPGDIIRTEETFEDGWAFGINMTTGKQGTFPMNCLEDDNVSEGDSRSFVSERSHNRRTSSLNPQNAQAIQMMLKNDGQNTNYPKSYYMSEINNK